MLFSKKSRFFIKLLLSVIIILLVFYQTEWSEIVQLLKQIDLFPYLISILLSLIAVFISGLKYNRLLKNTVLSESFVHFSKINLICRYYSFVIPTAIGIEAVRWYKVTNGRKGKLLFLSISVLERLFFLLCIFIFSAVPIFFFQHANTGVEGFIQQVKPMLVVSIIVATTGLATMILPGLSILMQKILKFEKAVEVYDIYINHFSLNKGNIGKLSQVVLLSIIWQITFVLRVFFITKSLDLNLSVFDTSWIGSLVLLLQALPVSFAGIGIREGAYAYVFSLMGLPFEKGVLTGILFLIQMLLLAFIGFFLEFSKKRPAK